MEELARQSDPAQGAAVNSDPATPSESPQGTREQDVATTEIDLAEVLSPDKETEQAGTVTTNPALAAEQVAMQAMYD